MTTMIFDIPLIQTQQMSLIEELKLKELNSANNMLFRLINERCQQTNNNLLLQLPVPYESFAGKSVSPAQTPRELASPTPLTPTELNVDQPVAPATVLPSFTVNSPSSSPSTSSVDSGVESEDDRRPHQCPECGKRFRFKSNLFEHKTLHQQSTPYVCIFCNKSCRLKGNLKKHLQIHVSSSEALEALWKARFSRSSGRPRKQVPSVSQPANNLHPQQLPTPTPTYNLSIQQAPLLSAHSGANLHQALFDLNSLLDFKASPQFLATTAAFNRL